MWTGYAKAMEQEKFQPSAAAAALIGLLALASAMGIGRFSLTPILPLMQQDAGLSFALGGWLATANYVGYLAGALICIVLASALSSWVHRAKPAEKTDAGKDGNADGNGKNRPRAMV